jgi:hypothetical protein
MNRIHRQRYRVTQNSTLYSMRHDKYYTTRRIAKKFFLENDLEY